MMRVRRRFPDTITRRRESAGAYNDFGEFEPGAVVDAALRCSLQPISLEDNDAVGGARLSSRLVVYVQETPSIGGAFTSGFSIGFLIEPIDSDGNLAALVAAFDNRNADRVLVGEANAAVEYVVEESQTWPRSHTRAILLRET